MTTTRPSEQVAAPADSGSPFARVFDISPVPLAISTIAEGRFLAVNDSWLALFGYRREEVLGRTSQALGMLVHPAGRDEAVQRMRAEGVLRNLEARLRTRSGEVLHVILSAVPDPAGETWLTAHVDISDRKHVEAERDRLLESATAARTLAETALERLHAIQSITDSALVHLSLDAMLQELLVRLRRALQTDHALVLLLDEQRKTLSPRARSGEYHERIASLRIPLGEGVSGRVAQTGRPVIVDDLSRVDFVSGIEGVSQRDVLDRVQSSMAAPLQVEGKIIGVVSVSSARRRTFTSEELELLLLVADRAAPAVERGRLMETVKGAHEGLEALSRRLVEVQEAERAAVARELHDEVGQLLTGLNLMVDAGDLESETRRTEFKRVVGELIARVRDLSVSLRPPMLDTLGLLPALLWQIDRFETQSRIHVVFHHANLDRRFPSEVEMAAFRIVQEALTNVARHAAVERVGVDVIAEATRLRVRIDDEGRGFDVEAALAGPSSGLAGMRERARLLRGRLTIDSAPGTGSRLSLSLPLPRRAAARARE
jgi:PAS domain S-box-containing protein